jgi:hypothetical protein
VLVPFSCVMLMSIIECGRGEWACACELCNPAVYKPGQQG